MRYLITTYITDPGIGERRTIRKCPVAYTLATELASEPATVEKAGPRARRR